jgi:hypothetical protein
MIKFGSELPTPLSATSIQALQTQLTRSLNQPSFRLHADLRELLSLANGLDATVNALIDGILWPSDATLRLVASSASQSVPLQSYFTLDATKVAFKYDLASGCVYHVQRGVLILGPPAVIFCSLSHMIHCLLLCVRHHDPPGFVAPLSFSLSRAALFSQLGNTPELRARFEDGTSLPSKDPGVLPDLVAGHWSKVLLYSFIYSIYSTVLLY